jgi:hypothetical protein
MQLVESVCPFDLNFTGCYKELRNIDHLLPSRLDIVSSQAQNQLDMPLWEFRFFWHQLYYTYKMCRIYHNLESRKFVQIMIATFFTSCRFGGEDNEYNGGDLSNDLFSVF